MPVNPTTGARLSLPRVNGLVRAAASDGVGGWYVVGDFVYAGSVLRNGTARVNASGAVTAWNPQVSGAVHSVVVSGGVVYLGGAFTQVSGQARNGVDPSTRRPARSAPGTLAPTAP